MTNKYQSGQERYEKPRDPAVDHPDYYNAGGIEVLDVIAAFGLNFNTGNAVKYICRSGRKPGADKLTDLRKAAFYLAHEIEGLEKRRIRQNE